MPTQHFLVKMKSQAILPILDKLTIELEKDFEEFLRRETIFVFQCYRAGASIWWRKLLRLGIKIPDDSDIRNWIVSYTSPPFWMCFNPKVMELAHEHFNKRTFVIKSDLKYIQQLKSKCMQNDDVGVWIQFVERHPALSSVK